MTNISTINPTLPAMDAPIASAPVRGNFAAAVNDINYIYELIAAIPIAQGTVTSVSGVNINGITWSVANPTTAATITISLGAITPSSVAATGNVSGTTLTSTVATGTAPLIVSSTTPVSNLSIGGNAATATSAGTVTTINGLIAAGSNVTVTGSGTQASPYSIASSGGGGAVSSVSNSDSTLTISPTTGNVVASLNLGNANIWTGQQTFVSPKLGTPASGVATNLTGTAGGLTAGAVSTINGLVSQGTNVTITGSGTPISPYNISASGSGSPAFNSITSGTNTTAAMVVGSGGSLGVSGSGTIAATSAPVSGITGLGSGVATWLATPTSANLASAVATTSTGSGALVFGTSPAISGATLSGSTALGTPASGVLTNCTGTASGLTAGNVTTNANLTGPITSSGNATSVASQTGTGSTFVMSAGPTITGTLAAATVTASSSVTMLQNTAATSGSKQVASNIFTLGANAWDSTPASAPANLTVQWTPAPGDNSAAALLDFEMGKVTGVFGAMHEVRFNGVNTYINVINSNDGKGAIFGISNSTAQFGLKPNGGSLQTYLSISNTGKVSTNANSSLGNPTARNTLDDGSGNMTISGHLTIEGVTSTGATGTGKIVFGTSPTINTPIILYPYVAKTANYTVIITDDTVEATSGTFTITLLTAVGNTGKEYNIINSGTGIITVNTTSSQTIAGQLTQVLSQQYESLTVRSNGANWLVI